MRRVKIFCFLLLSLILINSKIYSQEIEFVPHTIVSRELSNIDAEVVSTVDLDDDGDMDVLSINYSGNFVWFENDGEGYYYIHLIIIEADDITSIFTADIDSDGDMDVLSASQDDDDIVWFENDGNENFTEHIIETNVIGLTYIYVADVDDDGDMDILSVSDVSYWSGTISWHENNGEEIFDAHVITSDADGARLIYAVDIDYDEDIDILFTTYHPDVKTIQWLENDGNNNFDQHIIASDTSRITSIFLIDIDFDGDMDFIFSSFISNDIGWYENDGNQNFTIHIITTNTFQSKSVYAIDVDDDDDIDILYAIYHPDYGTLHWLENVGNNNFIEHIISSDVYGVSLVFAADIDCDGDIDVFSAFSSYSDSEIVYYKNDGNENFSPQVINVIADEARSVYAVDINGDGAMDVLSASVEDNKIAWYKNDGNENFTSRIISTNALWAYSVYSIDIDSDGDMDVLSASRIDNKIAWYENDGNENFSEHVITTNAQGATSVFAIDIDGNGFMDVLSASYNDDKIAWYENDGNENFDSHTISTNADRPFSVYAVDVDSDGDMDVLSAGYNKIAWFENDGFENFIEHDITTNVINGYSVYVTDVDSDGDMDVLSASAFWDHKIAWYENDGNEDFTAYDITTNAERARSVYAIDMDNDGDMDVLSASAGDDKIAWYENDGNEDFTAHEITTNANHARSVYAIDMDNDGDIDVLSASANDDKIAWYENIQYTGVNPDFVGNPTYGCIPLEVNFIDISIGNPLMWEWDFQNDGIIDSNEQNPLFTYTESGLYTVSLTVSDGTNTDTETKVDYIDVSETAIEIEEIPFETKLLGSYPNPFNPSTLIDFSIQNDSQIELSVFNIKGQKIKTLAQNEFTRGNHSIIWNGDDESGKSVSSGIYYYNLNVNGITVSVRKCLLLK